MGTSFDILPAALRYLQNHHSLLVPESDEGFPHTFLSFLLDQTVVGIVGEPTAKDELHL